MESFSSEGKFYIQYFLLLYMGHWSVSHQSLPKEEISIVSYIYTVNVTDHTFISMMGILYKVMIVI